MDMDQRAETIVTALRTMRKWGFAVIEDKESVKQDEGERMKRAEVVAVELLGPDAKGSAAASRLASALLKGAEATRSLSQFAAN